MRRLGREAELLPLGLHGRVLPHALPRLVGELDRRLAAAGEAEIERQRRGGDDEREEEERVEGLPNCDCFGG